MTYGPPNGLPNNKDTCVIAFEEQLRRVFKNLDPRQCGYQEGFELESQSFEKCCPRDLIDMAWKSAQEKCPEIQFGPNKWIVKTCEESPAGFVASLHNAKQSLCYRPNGFFECP